MQIKAQPVSDLSTPESQEQGIEGRTKTSLSPIPLRKRLRFRIAAEVALGISVLFTIYAVLMTWAIGISTEAALRERAAVASQIAVMVDGFLDTASQQMTILAGEVAWNQDGTLPAAQQPSLTMLIRLASTFSKMGVTDRDGRLIWHAGQPEDEQAWLASGALAQALRTGSPAISTGQGAEEHSPIAVMALPFNDSRGARAGAIVGGLNLASTGMDVLSLPGGGAGLLAEMVDSEGRVLSSSTGRDTLYVSQAHFALLSDALRNGQPGIAIHEAGPWQGHVVAFAPFKHMSGGVFLEEAADMALSVPRNLQRSGIAIGIVALLLFSLVIWWHIRHITWPVEEVAEAAGRMAHGSFDHPVPINGEDELGLLARSLEEMRIKLKASWEQRQNWVRELEQQVEGRTKEVHDLLGKIISAQEEERKRVARELHDGTAQYLATLMVSLDRIELSPSKVSEAEQQLWRRVQEDAHHALAEVRRLISDLRPAALDDLGLVSAIRWYAENRLSHLGTCLHFEVVGEERRLNSTLESALFRIAQESVNNVVKHAEASHARLQLTFADGSVNLTIEDDGLGFKPESTSQGLGLAGMKERASLVGGILSLDSCPGKGTCVTVNIPIPEDKDE